MKMEGKIQEIEGRETDEGKKYKRIQIDSKWGSYWGNTKDLEVGTKVKAKYEEVQGGQFTNWKKITPLPQENKKDDGKQSSSEKSQKGQVKEARKRFEIRKQVALKATVNMGENLTLGEVKQAYPVLVNLLSKRPDEFGKVKEEDSDE